MPFTFEITFLTQGACRVELKLGMKLKKYTVTMWEPFMNGVSGMYFT